MKPSEKVFWALDRPWNEFLQAWKTVRRKASERSVHEVRVSARRLIENLEFARAVSTPRNVRKLMRRLKKVLKRTSALRDLQVQLKTGANLPRSKAIASFTGHLHRLERQRINKLKKKFKRTEKKRLTGTFQDVHSQFIRSQRAGRKMQIHNGGKRILATHYSKFLEAKRRFDASQPHNEEALHEMRIALKKLRYATEAAHPLIVDTKKEHIETMRAFQKLMGDTRDLEILRVELEHWANQKGKKLAVIPAVRELEEKRQALLNELVVASHDLTRLMDSSAVRSNEPLIA